MVLKRLKSVKCVNKEEELFEIVLKAVRQFDPDILVGFEIQKSSWSFLVRRALRLKIVDYCSDLSRLPKQKRESFLRIFQSKFS